MRRRKWNRISLLVLGAMFALGCDDDDETTGPDVVTRLLIRGSMDAQSQNLIITRRGLAVTDAMVTVNGVTIPHIGDGFYQGQLPAVVPAGSPLNVQVSADGASVQGSGIVPEAPVLTAPATGTVFAPTDFITVSWTSASDPDGFQVSVFSEVEFGPVVSPVPGTARELMIAADDIGLGEDLPIDVSAINAGSFTGSVDPDSRVDVLAVGSPDVVITIQQ